MKKPNNPPLTPEQIAKIQSSLAFGAIFYEDIKAELVDHFATEIENELDSGKTFESLLEEKLAAFDKVNFQRNLLLQKHLGMSKAIFNKMFSFWLLVKVTVMTYVVGFIVTAFSTYTPDFAEKILKIAFMLFFVAILSAGIFRARLLKNSQIVAAGNSLFLIAIFSQFALRLEWLGWTGFSNQTLLYVFTFWFCLLLVAGFRVLSDTVKKTQLA